MYEKEHIIEKGPLKQEIAVVLTDSKFVVNRRYF